MLATQSADLASQPPMLATQASQLSGLQRSGSADVLGGSQHVDLLQADAGEDSLQNELDAMLGGGLQHGGSSGSLGGDSLGDSLPHGTGDLLAGSPPAAAASEGAAPSLGVDAPSQPSQQSSQGALERDLAAVMEEDTEMKTRLPSTLAAGAASHEDDDARQFWEEAARTSADPARAEELRARPADGSSQPASAGSHGLLEGEASSQQHEAGSSQPPAEGAVSSSQQLELDLEMIIDQEAEDRPPSGRP